MRFPFVLVPVLLLSLASAQDVLDKMVGTWKFNSDQSKVKSEESFKGESLFKVEKTGSNKLHTEWIHDGKVVQVVDHVCDGTEHARQPRVLKGDKLTPSTTLSMETCDPKTFYIRTTRVGKEYMRLQTVLSPNGNTMTRTRTLMKEDGKSPEDTFVYDRQ